MVMKNFPDRPSDDFLDSILAASPAVLYALKGEGDALKSYWVSGNITRIMGYSVETCLSDPEWWPSNIHPEDREAAFARLPSLFTTGYLVHEYRFRHNDGQYVWIRDELRKSRSANSELNTYAGAWADITERVQAETAAREAEDRLRPQLERLFADAQEIAHLGTWEREVGADLLYWSAEVYRIFGVDKEYFEPTVEGLKQLVHPDDRDQFDRGFSTAVKVGESHTYQHRIVRPNGEVRWVEQRVKASVPDKNGIITRQGSVQDITGHRLLEARLQESEGRFRALIQNAPFTISMKDLDGKFVIANEMLERWYGIEPGEAIGKTASDLITDGTAAEHRAQDEEVMRTLKPLQQEHGVMMSDGKRHTVLVTKFPAFGIDDRPVGVGTINTDITEHREMQSRLQAAHKMEALGHLTGGIAHEFNNLLQAALGSLDLAQEQIRSGLDPHEWLGRVETACEGAARLTSQLLTYVGQQPQMRQRLDTGQTLQEMAELVRPLLGANVTLTVTVTDDLWPVELDPRGLQEALLNLAANARDAMPEGGTLTIESENCCLGRASTADWGFDVAPGDYVKIAVRDSGAGMSSDTLDRAFDPFYTTKETGAGTGLGLSMVFGFIHRQSGGYVRLRSAPDAGTSVELYLPRTNKETDAIQSSPDAPDDAFVATESKRILVVEDNAAVRDVVLAMLEKLGHKVESVATGAAALERLKKRDMDLVMTDVVMPDGVSGADLADQIHRRYPELMVILMTGYPKEELTRLGIEHGSYPVVTKPINMSDLVNLINEAFQNS